MSSLKRVWIGLVILLSACGGGYDSGGGGGSGRQYVFMSAATVLGNLGGLAGADSLCAGYAAGAGLSGGPWKAWLSDESTNAIDRIADAGPWYLVGTYTVAFNTKAQLGALNPSTPDINISESGATVPYYNGTSLAVWSGSESGGTASPGYTCLNWSTSSSSSPAKIIAIPNGSPMVVSDATCAGAVGGIHLICLEQ